MADFVLRVVEGNAAGTEVPVGDELLLGRGVEKPGNLGGDGTLSRRHARIVRGGGGELLLEDLGSHNGTLVNGAAITAQVVLAVGDRIEMGETALELVSVEPAVPAPPVVPSDPGRTRVSHRIVTPDPPPAEPDTPTPAPRDQPTRLGEVPVAVPPSRDQPTRLGEVPVEVPPSRDQPTRLGEVPVEVAPSRDQPTRLGEVPAPTATEPEEDGEVEVPRVSWWRRLLRGSR